MISRMGFSLSLCPDFEQKRLQLFEVGAQRLFTLFDFFFGAIPVFSDKRQASAAVERDQGLNNVIAVDSGLVIGSGELENSFRPQLFGIVEIVNIERGDAAQF
jgi:hypothetical protein